MKQTWYQADTEPPFWCSTTKHNLDKDPDVDQDVKEDIWCDTEECVDSTEDQLGTSHLDEQVEWTPAKVCSPHMVTTGLLKKLGLKRDPAGHVTAGYIAQELKPSAVPIVIDTGCSISVTPFIEDFVMELQPTQEDVMQGLNDLV